MKLLETFFQRWKYLGGLLPCPFFPLRLSPRLARRVGELEWIAKSFTKGDATRTKNFQRWKFNDGSLPYPFLPLLLSLLMQKVMQVDIQIEHANDKQRAASKSPFSQFTDFQRWKSVNNTAPCPAPSFGFFSGVNHG